MAKSSPADSNGPSPSHPDMTLVRTFDAPRDVVFKAWVDREVLPRWWGPKGFTNPVCRIDPRAGGDIHIDMRGPNGIVYPMWGKFHEIREPERLVFSSGALNAEGKLLFEIVNTITFEEEGGKTRLTVHTRVAMMTPEAVPYLAGAPTGWGQSLDRLAAEVGSGGR